MGRVGNAGTWYGRMGFATSPFAARGREPRCRSMQQRRRDHHSCCDSCSSVASATEATWVRRNMQSASIPNSSSKCHTRFTVTGRGRFPAWSTSRRLSHQSCWALVALLTSTSYKLFCSSKCIRRSCSKSSFFLDCTSRAETYSSRNHVRWKTSKLASHIWIWSGLLSWSFMVPCLTRVIEAAGIEQSQLPRSISNCEDWLRFVRTWLVSLQIEASADNNILVVPGDFKGQKGRRFLLSRIMTYCVACTGWWARLQRTTSTNGCTEKLKSKESVSCHRGLVLSILYVIAIS